MAPTRDKWVRRFVIPETTRHKKGFTIYKITSVVFLRSSHEEISTVSVWKRYNDFKKLYNELAALYSTSQIKEDFPTFSKSKFFGRFEAEVIEERRECALKFLEFIGKHSYLYSSNIFIKFFETSHVDYRAIDCSQSLSSDTSEDDRNAYLNSTDDVTATKSTFSREPKNVETSLISTCSILSTPDCADKTEEISESKDSKKSKPVKISTNDSRVRRVYIKEEKTTDVNVSVKDIAPALENDLSESSKANGYEEDTIPSITKGKNPTEMQTSYSVARIEETIEESKSLVLDGSDLPQLWPDSSQYILIAAAHMSAALRHEAIAEYEEAFTQYKMGISSLLTGVQSDSDKIRAETIKEKISKYLERAEKLYIKLVNCNISLLNKPVSELRNYKVLKIMRSMMLVKDVSEKCLRVVKAVEKTTAHNENINNILRGHIPYMVRLYACIETETTVFLVLDYLSRGRLWDFIMLYYKSNVNDIHDSKESKIEKTIDIDLKENPAKKSLECADSFDQLDHKRKDSKVQLQTYSLAVEEEPEEYTDVPTTQLLEKAQILLQSVNATLEKSNSIANRLHESHHLSCTDSTTFLNIKNAANQSEKWNVVSMNTNKVQTELDITEYEQREDSSTPSISENSITTNSSLANDMKTTKSQYSTDNSSTSNSYKDFGFCDGESTNSSTDKLKTVFKHYMNSTVLTESTNNNYSSSNNNNFDVEQELWTIPEKVIRLWAAEILLALEALHQQEVIIFDLKPDKLLLDDNGHIQLTYIVPRHDIDLSKHKQPYASPELCMFLPTVPLTPATDIWSFGVILYELIIGNKFQTRHSGIFHSHSIINVPSRLTENAKSLILNILKYQPNERLTIPEIKQHPFFRDIVWSNLVNPN